MSPLATMMAEPGAAAPVVRTALFAAANVAIALGYVFLALFVVPKVTVRLRRTLIGAAGFFLLCGLHHLENVFTVLLTPHLSVERASAGWHMLLIDVPQALAVWMFVTGLYVELVRRGSPRSGPLPAGRDGLGER